MFLPSRAEAKITLQPDFEGTIVVTKPNGEISLIEAGEQVPDIPNESTIEVFDGKFTVSVEAGDQVTTSCLDHDGSETGAGSMAVSCGEDSGNVKALRGTVKVTDEAGKETVLQEGQEYPVRAGGPKAKTAPPTQALETAAGKPVGGNLADNTPPDGRSIEASPS